MATKIPDVGGVFRRLEVNNNTIAQTPLIQRRYTPCTKSNQRSRVFTRTPLPTQRQKTSRRIEELKAHSHQRPRSILRTKNTTKEPSEGLSSQIVGKTWRVYRASPFYRLKLDKKSFKTYERHLNSWLAVGSCLNTIENNARKTSFKKVEGDSAGEYGIEIKVFSNDGKENKQKNAPELIAVLYSERKSEGFERRISEEGTSEADTDDFMSFPVCLIKSSVLVKERFLEWLEAQFGCKISLLCFSPLDLAWLVSLCSGIGEPSHSTELTYQVPAMVEGLDTICFNIAAQDARKIWNNIHDPCKEFFTSQEAMTFLKSLECHFYHHFKINLDEMQLSTIGTSVVYIGRDGQLKILQKDFVCYILQQLVQLAKL